MRIIPVNNNQPNFKARFKSKTVIDRALISFTEGLDPQDAERFKKAFLAVRNRFDYTKRLRRISLGTHTPIVITDVSLGVPQRDTMEKAGKMGRVIITFPTLKKTGKVIRDFPFLNGTPEERGESVADLILNTVEGFLRGATT